ncbi:uncharacterized protein AB675_2195 [Cyphellophora attinorum]|uniref:BTB domain-containing protein n=1 Tax=Cyphellophora attinorum TaxID=1664694 RepID=A0A0N0NPP1_9EURO|nr:uncharacterized protein AB675_2195 [Phialophora attinorum]KPI42948.1 hypothetical protein AB675_2195 [Phialophora attinorum]
MSTEDADYPRDEACQALREARFADFTITCDGKIFKVHRPTIYYKSNYFKALLDNDFKEKADATVDLKETTPVAVAIVLLYCYAREVTELCKCPYKWLSKTWPQYFSDSEGPFAEMDALLDAYVLADRLLMKTAKVVIACELLRKLTEGHAASYSIPTDAKQLWKTGMIQLIDRIYNKAPVGDGGLRSAMSGLIFRNIFNTWGNFDQLKQIAREKDADAFVALEILANYDYKQQSTFTQCLNKTME